MSRYDRTCDSTEEWSFLNFHKDILKKPDSSWHFDRDELHEVAIIYFKLQRDAGCELKQDLPSKEFSNVLHKAFGMADETLIERMFSALDSITSTVPLRKWISAMSLFLRGSLKQKIKYCFRVYDASGKGEIRRVRMLKLLSKCVFKHHDEDVDQAVKDFADIIINKVDIDCDGIISFEDYQQSVLKEPLLLECFGQCLPDRKHVYAFLMTFTDKIKDM